MFNTTRVYNNVYHPETIAVHEHRAPTDKSIKLIREMEKEAMNSIVSMSKIEDNVFNVKWYICADAHSWEDRCRCVFTLNGKEYDFDFLLPRRTKDSSHIISKIKEEILKKLTDVLMEQLFKNCEKILI